MYLLFCSVFCQAVAKMVQECYKYVDDMTDLTIKLRLIDTLRTVTAGKVWNVWKGLYMRDKRRIVYIYLNSCRIMHTILWHIRKA